jgi:hypothetical protein
MSFDKTLTFAFASLVLGFTTTSCGAEDSDGGDDGGDDDGSPAACAVASGACVNGCIVPQCGAQIDACSDDATCDAAKDEMVSCVCDAQRAGDSNAVGTCFATFTNTGGILSTPFSDCAMSSCATPCGL